MPGLRPQQPPRLHSLLASAAYGWWRLWRWCYPAAGNVLDDVVRHETAPRHRARARLAFLVRLPLLARAQAAAERSPTTRTRDSDAPPPQPPGAAMREAAIALLGLGWTISAIAIAVSMAATGNFLFEYAPQPGQEEVGSPYFHVAAPAFLLPLPFAASVFAWGWLRTRLGR